MDGVTRIFERIQSIETRFGNSTQVSTASKSFDREFKKAINTSQQTPKQGEIAKLVKEAAIKSGVDPKLALAVADAESSFDPSATSPVGAAGVMQLMPDTARDLGVKNIYDPKENIEGGVRYLQQMLTSFNGDVKKALAAYNAGPEAVKKYNDIPPYPETQEYVAKIVASYKG